MDAGRYRRVVQVRPRSSDQFLRRIGQPGTEQTALEYQYRRYFWPIIALGDDGGSESGGGDNTEQDVAGSVGPQAPLRRTDPVEGGNPGQVERWQRPILVPLVVP